MVRWMRAQAEFGMEIGVQMLSPTIRPVTARVCNEEGQCGEHQACLMLPSSEGLDQPPTLITPNFFHNFATRLMLIEGARKRVVSLSRTRENTGAFAQFEFTETVRETKPAPPPPIAPVIVEEVPAPTPETSTDPTPDARKEESEFESIWNNL